MKAIVIGLGLIGSDYGEQSHAGVYKASDRIELVAGIDTDAERRERFEAQWKVPAFFGIGPWPPIDVVSICTPSHVRIPVIEQALELRPKAIWCEKPLAESVAEGEEIVKLCRDAALQVNFQRRFDPVHQHAKGYDLGRPVHFHCTFTGDMLRVGCHAIDLSRWFDADTMNLNPIEANGTTVFDVELTGPKGRIVLAAMGQQMFIGQTLESRVFPGVMEQPLRCIFETGLRSAMRNGLASLLDHIEKGTPLLCTGEDGLAALRIHEAIA